MNKVDLLTIDYDGLDRHVADYTEKNGEAPAGIVIDCFTVWSLIGALRGSCDSEVTEKTLLGGPDAFAETKLRGLQVIVKIPRVPGQRFADLVDQAAIDAELGPIADKPKYPNGGGQ